MQISRRITHAALAMACLGASTMLVAVGGTGATAQDGKWWEKIFSPETSSYTRPQRKSTRAESKKPEALDDLREGPVPLRSDEMLQQINVAIKRYQKIVQRGGWPDLAKLRLVRPGDDNEAIPAVRHRLIISGDIPAKAADYYRGSYHFDDWLAYGVRAFQARHGLRVTGRLDRPTRGQLAVSAKARLSQLELNKRRISALIEGRVEDRYILVNVPAFQLEAVERYEVKQRHRVIVGKPDRQTPSIVATIKGLNFFPFWHVPESIAKLDLIPRLRKQRDYLNQEHIRIVKGSFSGPEVNLDELDLSSVNTKQMHFRQDPGPWNALGLVRINMPNQHIVYMHDTPMKDLFNQRHRAFSAGCVRVQNVMDLVAWIAKYEPGFAREGAVEQMLERGSGMSFKDGRPKDLDVTLIRPIPVHFTYITAWAEADGRVEFRPDIYGRDGATELVGDDDPDAPAPPVMLAP